MFERNKIDTPEQGTVSAEITLDDDRRLNGKFVIPVSKSIYDVLNGSGGFIEFEPFDGERQLISKQTVRTVKLISVPRGENLNARIRSLDGFDPHMILGVSKETKWDDVRSAYLRLAKDYHPDRYSTAELPPEVRDYLSTMARRVNAAYDTLEAGRQAAGNRRPALATPIYTSQPRG